jgi:hypothetical protein
MTTKKLPSHFSKEFDEKADRNFRTFRQFSHLQKSIHEASDLVLKQKESTKSLIKPAPKTTISSQRDLTVRSTYRLDKLCKSSFEELEAMPKMTKTLYTERAKQRARIIFLENLQSGPPPGSFRKSREEDDIHKDPLDFALEKLSKASLAFDPSNSNTLQGFHGALLTKEEFRSLLFRLLHISLTSEELDELFEYYDTGKSRR